MLDTSHLIFASDLTTIPLTGPQVSQAKATALKDAQMNARLSIPLAALLLLAAIQVPPMPAAADAVADCTGYANTIQTDTFTVDPGTTLTLTEPTAIVANRVSILGHLATSNALPGQDAPDLCIQAETIEVLGVLSAGNGHDGLNDYANTTATGGPGTNGGDLTLTVVDNPDNLLPPSLNIGPNAVITTGSGGRGGAALAGDPCGWLSTSNLLHLSSQCPAITCPALTSAILPPSRTDPCEIPSIGGIDCEQLVSLIPGNWRQDPCPGAQPPLPDCNVAFTLFGLTSGALDCAPTGDPQMPSCDALAGFLTAYFAIQQLACSPGDAIPDCVGDFTRPTTATGGRGGDAGTLRLSSTAPQLLDGLPTNLLLIGTGGDGGTAIAASSLLTHDRAAYGGEGGSSTMLWNGQADALPHLPGSSQGGNGGPAFSSPDGICQTVRDCLADIDHPFWCVPSPICDPTDPPLLFIGCMVKALIPCGGPPVGPDGEPVVGCPGSPATEQSGPAAPGGDGASGTAGSAGMDYSVSIGSSGPSGSADCGATTDGGTGGAGLPGGAGGGSAATGGNGGNGVLRGGDGGYASDTASKGGGGGQGGVGGNGAVGCFGTAWAHPGRGGVGGDGGDSGDGIAQGGYGGGAYVFGGFGGGAEGHPGSPGQGGTGGSGGVAAIYCDPITWVCFTEPAGQWGCGGRNGNVGLVKVQGGNGGVSNTNTALNGRPGVPPPPGTYVPASQPPGSHSGHGAGSPASPACPTP